MEVFMVYLWLKLDVFSAALSSMGNSLVQLGSSALVITAVVAGLMLLFGPVNSDQEDTEKADKPEEKKPSIFWKRIKQMTIGSLAVILLGYTANFTSVALPTKKEAAILVASHYAVTAIKSQEVQEMVDLARLEARSWIAEKKKVLMVPPAASK